jgi:hypothetical protein
MGARVNFIFKQSDGNAVVLYSHWGEDSWSEDLQDNLMSETGFGISACANPEDMAFMDHPILIDLGNDNITDETGTHSIDSFIEYHAAGLLI